ncbi:hypothetical protein M407DRAFT_16757 [Tulasnella calospora MUT 4182]|uniref:Uncharacterized protein n=1 Tax=Tulasnella calospora MUT 4182 TaxID=1051891 RepID=A0A0C3MMA5_9AGAM|nr:hypothetical protein M407DRAFT_16757 [Tulasnella calospora MUT 4182]
MHKNAVTDNADAASPPYTMHSLSKATGSRANRPTKVKLSAQWYTVRNPKDTTEARR